MELVQKLTPKTLGWSRLAIQTALAAVVPGERILMGRVAGIANGLRPTLDEKTGEMQYGLKGTFRGISAAPGKGAMTSGVCYLPSGIQAMIEGSLAQAQEDDPNATVNFVVDLYCLSDTNKAGYTFMGVNIMANEGNDPLAALLEVAGKEAAQITGPEIRDEAEPAADAE